MVMRRVGIVIGVMALLFCTLAFGSWVWVSRAVAQVKANTVCLSQRDRSQVADGTITQRQQDLIVTKTIAFQKGVPKSNLSWHLRGALIHSTYVAFWSREKRIVIFDRLARQMKDCPMWRGRLVGAPAVQRSAHGS
jgi:hypothetical protein